MTGEDIIRMLGLEPLPVEGGYYRETWRPADSSGGRPLGTAIYYLLTPEVRSLMHRLPTDEIFHFYLGDPVEMLILHPDGKSETVLLGKDIANGQRVQFVVPADAWQGSCLAEGGSFALMGTTMAPGFIFEDYEPGERKYLQKLYPDAADVVKMLTP